MNKGNQHTKKSTEIFITKYPDWTKRKRRNTLNGHMICSLKLFYIVSQWVKHMQHWLFLSISKNVNNKRLRHPCWGRVVVMRLYLHIAFACNWFKQVTEYILLLTHHKTRHHRHHIFPRDYSWKLNECSLRNAYLRRYRIDKEVFVIPQMRTTQMTWSMSFSVCSDHNLLGWKDLCHDTKHRWTLA